MTLRVPPGSALVEDELMRELGIGRTPLREAIKRLALENLVEIRPRRGTYVTEVNVADIVHITEVRAELEGHAAQLAAMRMEDAGRAEAEALLAELEDLDPRDSDALMHVDVADIVHMTEVRVELEAQAAELAALRMDADARARAEALVAELQTLSSEDHDALMRFDERIHRFVYATSRNPYLAETLERYFALSLRIWYLVLDRVPGLWTAVHDQREMIQALLTRDGARAHELMKEHIRAFQREIVVAFTR